MPNGAICSFTVEVGVGMGATVKILEYKDMEPFFIKGERDEP